METSNRETLKRNIMYSQSHQFLYGEKGEERTSFLKGIESSYPIVVNQESPMGIYINVLGLGSINTNLSDQNDIILLGVHSRYYDFLIADNLVEKIITVLKDLNDERISSFLEKINSSYINRFNRIYILTIEDLKKHLEEILAIYMYDYSQYIKTRDFGSFSCSECLSICMIEDFIKEVKTLLNNESYFNFIIDPQASLSILDKMAINKYISRRLHDIMSISVACQSRKDWYFGSVDGYPIRSTHDFISVNLDGIDKESGIKLILKPETSEEE